MSPYGLDAEREIESIYNAGLSIEELNLLPSPKYAYPLFIPLRTDELPYNYVVPVQWVAMDARQLLGRVRVDHSVASRMRGRDPIQLRSQLRVASPTRVLGVLNGADKLLEGFWGMPRRQFFRELASAGVNLCTGPTFSVVREGYTEDVGVPAAHNITMVRRHHMVATEMGSSGIPCAPNLYWRDDRNRAQWVEWLGVNRHVNVVSRDFSRTKDPSAFRPHLDGLAEILDRIGRKLHVILIGVGPRNSRYALETLASVGATCSLVTAHPIVVALSGGRRLRLNPSGDLNTDVSLTSSRLSLVGTNIRTFESYLASIAQPLLPYCENSLVHAVAVTS